MVTTEEFLEHHGIKGQKWGVRNKRNARKTSADHKKVAEIRKKHISQLTNKQLKVHNERLNLETKFVQANPSAVNRGQKAVKGLIAAGVTATTVYNMVNSPAGKAAMRIGAKKTASKAGARAPKEFVKLLSKR